MAESRIFRDMSVDGSHLLRDPGGEDLSHPPASPARIQETWVWKNRFPGARRVQVIAMHSRSDGSYRPHTHDFLELVLFTAGRMRHACPAGEGVLERGCLVVLRPGAWHELAEPRHSSYFNILFSQEVLARELAWTFDDPQLNLLLWKGPMTACGGAWIIRLPEEAVRRAGPVLHKLADLGDQDDPRTSRASKLGLALQLVGVFAEGMAAISPGREHRPFHPAVWRGMKLLRDEVRTAWTVPLLSQRLSLESSYLTRLFKSATGLPPMAYLARCRLEQAAAVLITSSEPVSAVAAAIGWEDPAYFARRFRAHFGLTASQYRRRFTPQPNDRRSPDARLECSS